MSIPIQLTLQILKYLYIVKYLVYEGANISTVSDLILSNPEVINFINKIISSRI